MKKYLLSFGLLAVVFMGAQFAYAKDGSDDNGEFEIKSSTGVHVELGDDKGGLRKDLRGMRGEFRQDGKEIKGDMKNIRGEWADKREEMKGEFDKKSEEFKTKREEWRKELHEKLGEVRGAIFLRYTIAVERLTTLHTKFDSRIAKLDADGKNTTSAKVELESSKTNLKKAKDEVAAAKAIVDAHINTNNDDNKDDDSEDKSKREEIRTHLKSAKEYLKASFQDIRDCLGELKKIPGVSTNVSAEATTQVNQ